MKEKLVVIVLLILFFGSGSVILAQTVQTLPKVNSFSFRIPNINKITQSIEKWAQ